MRKFFVAVLAAAVLVVLFAGAQGTAALWRASEQAAPGTVTTGSLSLAVGRGAVVERDYAFTELDSRTLVPGEFVQAPLVVSNTGTIGLGYGLAGASSSAPLPADGALAGALELSINEVVDAAACGENSLPSGTPLYKGPLGPAAAFGQVRSLAASGRGTSQETLCVRVTLPAGAPQGAAGGRLALVLQWRGGQQ